MTKDYSYVISRLKVSLEKHDKSIEHYKAVAQARQNELNAAQTVVDTAQSERDQILDAIILMSAGQPDD